MGGSKRKGGAKKSGQVHDKAGSMGSIGDVDLPFSGGDPFEDDFGDVEMRGSRRGAEFDIFMKTITGRTASFRVNALDTVAQLKLKVQDKLGVPVDQQRFIYGAKPMEDDMRSLRSYDVGKEAMIMLILRLADTAAPPSKTEPAAPSLFKVKEDTFTTRLQRLVLLVQIATWNKYVQWKEWLWATYDKLASVFAQVTSPLARALRRLVELVRTICVSVSAWVRGTVLSPLDRATRAVWNGLVSVARFIARAWDRVVARPVSYVCFDLAAPVLTAVYNRCVVAPVQWWCEWAPWAWRTAIVQPTRAVGNAVSGVWKWIWPHVVSMYGGATSFLRWSTNMANWGVVLPLRTLGEGAWSLGKRTYFALDRGAGRAASILRSVCQTSYDVGARVLTAFVREPIVFMWELVLEALDDMGQAIVDVVGLCSDAAADFFDRVVVWAARRTWHGLLVPLGEWCGRGSRIVGRAFGDVINSVFKLHVRIALSLWRVVQRSARAMGTGISDASRFVGRQVMAVWRSVCDVAYRVWNVLANAWNRAWSVVRDWGRAAWSVVAEFARAMGTGIADASRFVGRQVTAVWRSVCDVAYRVWNVLANAWNRAWSVVRDWGRAAWSVVAEGAGLVKTCLHSVGSVVNRWFKWVWSSCTAAMQSVWDGAYGWAQRGWTVCRGAAESVCTCTRTCARSIAQLLSTVWEHVWDGISPTVKFAVVRVSHCWDVCCGAVQAAVDRVREVARSVWQRLCRGIATALHHIVSRPLGWVWGYVCDIAHVVGGWAHAGWEALRGAAELVVGHAADLSLAVWSAFLTVYPVRIAREILFPRKGVTLSGFSLDVRPGQLRPKRECDDDDVSAIVIMKNNTPYTVWIRNAHSTIAQCDLSIDGQSVGSFYLAPRGTYGIDRAVDEPTKFVFVATEDADDFENFDGPSGAGSAEGDGLVEAKFLLPRRTSLAPLKGGKKARNKKAEHFSDSSVIARAEDEVSIGADESEPIIDMDEARTFDSEGDAETLVSGSTVFKGTSTTEIKEAPSLTTTMDEENPVWISLKLLASV